MDHQALERKSVTYGSIPMVSRRRRKNNSLSILYPTDYCSLFKESVDVQANKNYLPIIAGGDKNGRRSGVYHDTHGFGKEVEKKKNTVVLFFYAGISN